MTIKELENQISNLQTELEKLKQTEKKKNKEEKNKLRPWRANSRERYYLINIDGNVCEWVDLQDIGNDNLYKYGNYYRTRELAEQDAKELALRGRIRQLRDVFLEGYICGSDMFSIYYDTEINRYKPFDCLGLKIIGSIVFPSMLSAQQVCNILNKELEDKKS